MKKVYIISQRAWIGDTNTYSETTNLRAIIATLDKVKEWLSSYCDCLIQDAYEYCNKDIYLQEKEHYTKVKEYFEKCLNQYTEETFGIGIGISVYGFSIQCSKVIE